MRMNMHIYMYVYVYLYNMYKYGHDDDDVYLRFQHGKGFHNLVYMSNVEHINSSSKA
jgi:hypothetical protein